MHTNHHCSTSSMESRANSLKTLGLLGPKWNRAIVNVINYTCFPCCDKSNCLSGGKRTIQAFVELLHSLKGKVFVTM